MTAQDDKKKQSVTAPVNYSAIHGKEGEITRSSSEVITDVTKEIELKKELKEIGVEKLHGVIELPPDIKKLGVTPLGNQMPVGTSVAAVSLPISDDQILANTKAPVNSAIKWLAVWCIKRLKFAHLALKRIHGKIVRVKVQ